MDTALLIGLFQAATGEHLTRAEEDTLRDKWETTTCKNRVNELAKCILFFNILYQCDTHVVMFNYKSRIKAVAVIN